MRNVTGKSHGFHEIHKNSQFYVCSFCVCNGSALSESQLIVSRMRLNVYTENEMERFNGRLYFIKCTTMDGRRIRRQESRFTSVPGALRESADGQSDRRPVKRRFSPYPATGFPREDTPVCVDTRGPTCVIQ